MFGLIKTQKVDPGKKILGKSVADEEWRTKSKVSIKFPTFQADQKGKCKYFPCCFDIPLDIAMEGFAMLDVIFYTLCAAICGLLLTFEPFQGKTYLSALNDSINPPESRFAYLSELDNILRGLNLDDPADEGFDYDGVFSETSTTLGPNLFPEIPEHEYPKMSRAYSRIASWAKKYLQEVDNGCGDKYLENNLFGHELKVTDILYEETLKILIWANLMFALFGGLLLTSLCCFRGYVYSKLLIIIIWLLQLLPSYYFIKATILSQAYRLCFLQYGLGKTVRGQTACAYGILGSLLIYKPYELFIWANYIRRYFQNKDGKLLDESIFSVVKERENRYLPLQPLTGTDLTKHHYNHIVSGKRLFKLAIHHHHHKSPVTNPWLDRATSGGSSSSSD